MCSIALQFRDRGHAKPLPLEKLRHRGPDAQGHWRSPDGCCWIGHTRLALLELSKKGAQPMHDPETGNVIVFNGEIYNHLELRAQLCELKYQWRGGSDTETLLVAFRHWRRNTPSRLKGMFAFAIYNEREKSLFVARDRFGMKPIYYTCGKGELTLASEVRPLLGSSSRSCNSKSVASYLAWGACPEEQLIWPEIHCLPPGHILEFTGGGSLSVSGYWVAPARPKCVVSNPVSHVRELIEYSVEDHLQADVPIASFLSGGIDSSIITAMAAQKLGGPLQTFSVGFAQRSFDETEVAQHVARRYGTDHHRLELSEEETIEWVREAVSRLDLPSVDALNTYIVSKAVARQGVKVALTGLGGDELFGGYPIFQQFAKLRCLARLPARLRAMLACCGGFGRRLAELPCNDFAALIRWRRRFLTHRETHAAGLPPVSSNGVSGLANLPDDFARVSWVEMTSYMREMLLRDADQMSMAVSLELRIPFLDHELVEYVLHLPARLKKLYRGTKGLLVQACRDLLPPLVYRRSKMGFRLPMEDWIRGPLAGFATEGIDAVRALGLLKAAYLDQLERGFQVGKVHWTRVWSIVVLGHYLRASLTGSDSMAAPDLSDHDGVGISSCLSTMPFVPSADAIATTR